ncbi:YoaK family protein [soil metagenome]
MANWQLGWLLAFVAGATNAGGFLATRQYTSHMTGVVAAMADDVALADFKAVMAGVCALSGFMLGAVVTAWLVNFARRRRWHSEYALPLLLESGLLMMFGIAGARFRGFEALFVSATVTLLSFMMGLQNALISKLSNAEIRTTHVTGVVTDLGIELGRLLYWNRDRLATPAVRADVNRLAALAMLLVSFILGGVSGAFGFSRFGFACVMPLAVLLASLALVPALDDWRLRERAQP